MRKLFGAAAAFLCVLVISTPTFAQTSNATLGGTVVDTTNALIPGVTVTATNNQTGVVTTVLSNESGAYQFASLQPGVYTARASLPGFQTRSYNQIELGTSQQLRLNFTLQLATASTSIEVSIALDTLLATSSASVGNVLNANMVRDLPLPNRDVLDLIGTMAGVTGDGATASFAGGRVGSINTTVDGINTTPFRYENGVYSIIRVNPDMVGEVRIILAPADAETGRGSGQVQIQTKSGTNQYRGSVIWNVQNSAFNANTWQGNFNGTEPGWSNIHQLTGNYGGPILRNKTFFFTALDFQRSYSRANVSTTVLTADARKGLFRFFPGVNNGNALANVTTGTNPTAPVVDLSGNPVRPAAATGGLQSVNVFNYDPFRTAFDPSGWIQKLVGDMPLPNAFESGDGLNTATYRWVRPTSGTDNFTGTSDTSNRNQWNVKIDHNFNSRHKLTGNYTIEADWALQQQSNWPNGFDGELGRTPQLLTTSLVSTLSPTVLNEFRFGMNRISNHNWANYMHTETGEAAKAYLPNRNGIPVMVQPGAGNVSFPTHMLTFGTGDTNGVQKPVSWTYADTVSWTQGKHAYKGGLEIRRMGTDGFNSQRIVPHAIGGAGNIPVSGISSTTVPGLLGSNQTTMQNLLILLSGSLANVQQAFTLNDPKGTEFVDFTKLPVPGKFRFYKQNEWSAFFKDDWKVGSSFTLNLGLRYEFYGVPFEARGLMAAPVGGGLALLGYSGRTFADWKQFGPQKGDLTTVEFVGKNSPNPDRKIYQNDWNNFSPNLGFTWALPWFGKDKTVFRAGYGIAYSGGRRAVTLDVANSMPGLNEFATYTSPAYLSLSNFPMPVPRSKPFLLSPVTERTQTIDAADPNLVSPYIQNINASISRSLNRNLSLEVRYVGAKGTKLFGAIPINEVNVRTNGILEAFNITRAGGDAPLFDTMLNGLAINPGLPAVGSVVGGVRMTGSAALRQSTTFRGNIANGNVGAFASSLNTSTAVTGQGGGLIRNGGFPENFIVANPQFGTTTLFSNASSSMYHSMHTQLAVRSFHGLSYQGTYVWSKSMGVGTGDAFSGWRDATNRALDRELQANHRTHSFRSNGSFELPVGPNRLLLSNGPAWVSRLVERWQMAWIFNLSSGAPLNLTTIATTNTVGNTPNIVGAFPRKATARKVSNLAVYLEGYTSTTDPQCAAVTTLQTTRTSCTNSALLDASGNLVLTTPEPGKLGALGRRTIEGPGSFGFDVAASKAIRLGENRELQLRIDAQDVLNKPILGNPNLDINSANFGRITTAGGNRTFSASARVSF